MRIKGLKVEERITPEGIEMKFIYKLEKNIFTSIDFADIFKREQEKGSE